MAAVDDFYKMVLMKRAFHGIFVVVMRGRPSAEVEADDAEQEDDQDDAADDDELRPRPSAAAFAADDAAAGASSIDSDVSPMTAVQVADALRPRPPGSSAASVAGEDLLARCGDDRGLATRRHGPPAQGSAALPGGDEPLFSAAD